MKTLAFILMMLPCTLVSAQEGYQNQDTTAQHEAWTFATAQKNIKFSPLEVFSVIPTFGADLEVVLNDEIRLQGGLGLIVPSFQYLTKTESALFDKMGGYKLRAESKFFVLKKPTQYFSTELSMRHLIIKDNIGIGMEPSNTTNQWGPTEQNFAYFIKTDMTFHRFNSALNFKYGFQKEYDNGFICDFYFGLSMRRTHVRTWTDIPEGGTLPRTNNGFNWDLGDKLSRSYATPIIGIKLGFKIN